MLLLRYIVLFIYQLEEDIYNREQKKLDKRLDNNKKNDETRANFVKKDKRKINEFYNKIAIEI